jgi:hypothetical protein
MQKGSNMAREKLHGRVVISKDGPYAVTGGVPLAKQTIGSDADGGSETWTEGVVLPVADKYALCRWA